MSKKPLHPHIARFELLPAFAAFFIVGLKLSQLFDSDLAIPFFFFSSGAVVASAVLHRNRKISQILIAVAITAAAIFYGGLRIFPAVDSGEIRLLDGSSGSINGIFSGEYRIFRSGKIALVLRQCFLETASQTISLPGRVFCTVKSPALIPEPEQRYRISGRFSFGANQRFPSFSGSEISHVSNRSVMNELGGKIQRKLRDGLNMVLPTRHASIVTGFLLGDTSQISKEDRQLFRDTGISHLLAVSGQHIMVLSFVIAALLHLLRIPPVSRSILIAAFLLVYAFTTSGSPSIIRALTMYLVVAVIYHFEAFPSPTRPLGIAALVILFYDPSQICEPGFLLSFSAVAGIIMLKPMFEFFLCRACLPRSFARYLSVTFAANFAVIPMAALLFGSFSLVSLLVNPAVVWTFSIILPASFLVGLISAFSPGAGLLISPVLSLPLDGLLSFLQWSQSFTWANVYTGTLPGFVVAMTYALMLAGSGLWNRRMLISSCRKNDPRLQAVPSASQETVPLIRQPDNKPTTARLSAGESRPVLPVERHLTNIFKDQAIVKEVDAMLLSTRRRSLKDFSPPADLELEPNLLSLENQHLYYQLLDLNRQLIASEHFRLIQAQVYLLSVSGYEILNRISAHISPPPDPGELTLDFVVKDRYLALAILGDRLLHSSLLTRADSHNFMLLMSRGQTLFSRARNQLQRQLQGINAELIEQHFSLRRDLLTWCREFLEFDQEWRKSNLEANR